MTNEMYRILINRSSQFCIWENGTLMQFNIQQSLMLFNFQQNIFIQSSILELCILGRWGGAQSVLDFLLENNIRGENRNIMFLLFVSYVFYLGIRVCLF